MNPQEQTTSSELPLVAKLVVMEERWDEACAGLEPPAVRERYLAHAERQARDLENRNDVPFTRAELSARISEIDS
ncbi:MAG: hypothetical protein ACTHK7_14760 [Aureliella sp.]